MPTQLKYVDPARQRSWFSRAYAAFGSTRRGAFISRHVFWKLDPFLLRATRGRLSMALVIRTGLLETRGAKSGALRRNAIIYFHDGDRVTVAASNAGSARQPGWYHNLRAHPDVTFGGIAMRATVVSDEAERQRLWTLALPALREVPSGRGEAEPDDPHHPARGARVRRGGIVVAPTHQRRRPYVAGGRTAHQGLGIGPGTKPRHDDGIVTTLPALLTAARVRPTVVTWAAHPPEPADADAF